MATGPTPTELPRRADRRAPSLRDRRLAELVAELASCDRDQALDALRNRAEVADPLELVARAVTEVRRQVEPQDRLRVAGFLRTTATPLPRRPGSATALAERSAVDDHLVHHGSLRRWERSPSDGVPTGDLGATIEPDSQVIDLRDGTARFRRPR